jgi:proline dehydrogenase
MIDTASKAFFGSLASSTALKTLASRYGMRQNGGFARRFIAGENIEEAIAAARIVEASGLRQTLDLLGEGVSTASEATAATRAYMDVIDTIVQSGVGRNISLKLTQLGLTIDRATCVDNLRRIMVTATKHEFFVRIDMENSPYTQITFDVFETVWGLGYRNVGVVLQSYLPRSL